MAEFNCLTHRFSLDVNDTAAQVSLACKRGDTGIQLRIILTDNGMPYEITPGSAAVFTATKPDGTNLYNYCRIEGNTVVYDFTEQTVNVPGRVDVELRLTYGGMVLTSPSFLIIVDETIYDDLVPTSSDEATALTELIGKSEAAVTSCESATAYATQSASAAAKAAHEADLAADNARGVAQTVQNMLDSGEFQGETSLPVAHASSGDGIAYTATGGDLPTVSVADNMSQISAVGKGRQIVFIPWVKNQNDAPTLQLNGGEIIPIRLRAPQTQNNDDQSPEATLPVPVGALMRGVPYTMTFCGKYWLVDSQIAQFSCAGNEYQAAVMRAMAEVASGMADGDTIGMPIVNSMDGIDGHVSGAFIARSAAEYALPPEDGSVRLPTEGRVAEMLRKDITAAYKAWTPESGTEKTVENYAKTLPDGKYYIIHGGTVYMDIFTVYGNMKYRFIRRYEDDSCYMELFRGDQLTICVEDDVSSVMLYGRKMLMDWNIPLPTAEDVGKVLMASAVNRAAWTEVTNAEEVAV